MKMKIPIWYETLEWHSSTTTSHKVSQGVATVVGFTVLGKNNIPFFLSQSSVVRSQNLPTRKWNFGTPTRAFNTGPRKSPEKWFASQPAESWCQGEKEMVLMFSKCRHKRGANGATFPKCGRNMVQLEYYSPNMGEMRRKWQYSLQVWSPWSTPGDNLSKWASHEA